MYCFDQKALTVKGLSIRTSIDIRILYTKYMRGTERVY
jgi:hypothetical protein